jgi:peptidoglycan/LPS O-acetylase OafA/YrhL
MKQIHILLLLLVLAMILGAVSAYLETHHIREPLWWHFGSTFLAIGLIFAWYHMDSTLRSYRRTALLNIGVIVVAVIALPYYIVRSREKGHKGKDVMKLIGFFGLFLLSGAFGGILANFIG